MAASASASQSARKGIRSIETQFAALLAVVAGVLVEHHNALAELFGGSKLPTPTASMGIMAQVRMVGGAVVGIAVTTLVVNEVLTINSINNSSGPFSGVINSLETTGVAAMTLLVVGLVVAAASAIMRFMGSGF